MSDYQSGYQKNYGNNQQNRNYQQRSSGNYQHNNGQNRGAPKRREVHYDFIMPNPYRAFTIDVKFKAKEDIIKIFEEVAKKLEELGYTYRSGGNDSELDQRVSAIMSKKEVYLPWKGFNDLDSEYNYPSEKARDIANKYHPIYNELGFAVQAIVARMSHRVLGPDCLTPVDFLLCWTDDGVETHKARTTKTGTVGQVISIANDHNIPVFNFCNFDAKQRFIDYLKTVKDRQQPVKLDKGDSHTSSDHSGHTTDDASNASSDIGFDF